MANRSSSSIRVGLKVLFGLCMVTVLGASPSYALDRSSAGDETPAEKAPRGDTPEASKETNQDEDVDKPASPSSAKDAEDSKAQDSDASTEGGKSLQPTSDVHPVVRALRMTTEAGDLRAARFLCDVERDRASKAKTASHPEVVSRCVKIYLGAGDALAAKGKAGPAHVLWAYAAALKPELKKDFLYLSRLKAHPKKPDPLVKVTTVTPRTKSKRLQEQAKIVAKSVEPSEPPGPRGGDVFGFGLTGGFDGLLGVVVSFLYQERLSVEVAVGVLFPVIDTRVRYYGMKSAFTPVVGFGMTTPLAGDAHFDLDIPGYTSLYRLGQTLHVDIGLAWKVWEMDLFGGMAFITSLDQEHLDRLLFFPQFGLQAQFMF